MLKIKESIAMLTPWTRRIIVLCVTAVIITTLVTAGVTGNFDGLIGGLMALIQAD